MSGIQAPPNTPNVFVAEIPPEPPVLDLGDAALQKHIEKTIRKWLETGVRSEIK